MLSVRPVVVVGRMPQMLTAPATVNAKSASSALSRRHQIVHAERVDGPSEDTTPEGVSAVIEVSPLSTDDGNVICDRRLKG